MSCDMRFSSLTRDQTLTSDPESDETDHQEIPKRGKYFLNRTQKVFELTEKKINESIFY